MSVPANGTEQQVTVKMHGIQMPSGAKLRFTQSDGTYLGSIEFDAINSQALGLIGNMFQQFVAQQTGGIQLATAGAVPGLRTP